MVVAYHLEFCLNDTPQRGGCQEIFRNSYDKTKFLCYTIASMMISIMLTIQSFSQFGSVYSDEREVRCNPVATIITVIEIRFISRNTHQTMRRQQRLTLTHIWTWKVQPFFQRRKNFSFCAPKDSCAFLLCFIKQIKRRFLFSDNAYGTKIIQHV